MNQSVYFLIVFILLAACSFDKKSGIWTGSDEEKRIFNLEKEQSQEKEIIKIFSTSDSSLKEISTKKNVILTTPYKNLSWTMSAYNLQNQIGNFYLPKADKIFLKKKIGKNKFNILKTMSSPLISGDNIVVTDDRGYIYSINKRGKTNWKRNIYKKAHKKIYKTLSLSINNENIYVSDNIGFVYSINLNSGNVNWVKNHGIPIKSSIKVFDNKIYFINQDNRILCLDAKDGSLLWGRRSISSFIKSQGFLSIAISESGELFSLEWRKWDKVLLRNSKARIKRIFKTYYYSAHGFDFNFDFNISGTWIKNLRSRLTFPAGAQLLPWWKKRKLRSNPFDADGKMCEKKNL